MKKWIAWMLVVAALSLLGGCTAKEEPQQVPPDGDMQPVLSQTTDVWGVTLTAQQVTPSGLTLIATHSGEMPGELTTGSAFCLERAGADGAWEAVPTLIPEGEISWTMEAYLIAANDAVEWPVNWEYLYGQLPAGSYRIEKELMLFRGPGDFDTQTIYAQFGIVD